MSSQPLSSWYGITVEGDRVTRIVLENNNVAGDLRGSLLSLTSLVELDLSGNQLEALPDLTSLPSLSRLDVSMNQLTFEDLEPNAGIQPDFIYAPQANDRVGAAVNTAVWEGDDITLFVPVAGTANQYQWLHNGTEIPGATSNPWVLSSASLADTGRYELRITNTLVPLLTLYSEPRHLNILEHITDLYVSLSGNDGNSGSNIEFPLKTISHALSMITADSNHPQTIHLTNGVYSPSATGEQFPLDIPSHVSLIGASREGTILDAEGNGGIRVHESENVVLENFTVTGGHQFRGGGIWGWRASITVRNILLYDNHATEGGGLLYSEGSLWDNGSMILENVLVTRNWADDGGGLYIGSGDVHLAGITVSKNFAYRNGGGIYLNSTVEFSTNNKCNIYLNRSGQYGNDLCDYWGEQLHQVVVDTFTYFQPTPEAVYNLNNFTFDITHGLVEPVTADLYISPDGSDANSGLSAAEPLRTILLATAKVTADSSHPRIIYLNEGKYSAVTNGELLPVTLPSYVTLAGVSAQTTILDGASRRPVMVLHEKKQTTINDLTMIQGASQGGLYCDKSTVVLKRVVLAYNKAQIGAGIFANQSTLNMDHVTIANNYAPGGGHGLYLSRSNAHLTNCIVRNPIIPLPENIKVYYSILSVEYSDVRGGVTGVITGHQTTLNWLDGNIDADPLFCKSSHTDFSLAGSSPCVEAGELGSNIGAGDIGCATPLDISEVEQTIPGSYSLSQNRPNPFNPVTTIRYELPEGAIVRLVVYDLQGREVAYLADSYLPAGSYESIWDGRSVDGRVLPSGIYIARFTTPGYSKSIKMVLLK
jgi:hypothetical protein